MLAVADGELRARLARLLADQEVEAAEPGPPALDLLERHPSLRLLILFEANPDHGALDLLQAARQQRSDLAVIVLSAYPTIEHATEQQELMERVRAGTAVVVDVRPAEEYGAGHIPGAVSVPLEDLARRLKELPARKEVVAYCRGPYCLMAFEAVKVLRGRGRRARRLVDGFPEWRAAGLPVEPGGRGEAR